MITRISALFLVIAFVSIVQTYPYGEASGIQGMTAFSLGFVIIVGFLMGEIVVRIQLPRITGYLIAGMLVGPYMGGWLTKETVKHLTLIDQIALSLIAISAGCELRLSELKHHWKGVVSITLFQTIGLFALGTAAFWLLSGWFSFFEDGSQIVRLQAGLVFGVIAAAQSPATTIAIITDLKAKGPATESVLGSAVLKDVLVIILFTLILSMNHLLDGGELTMEPFVELGGELFFSIAFGVVAGWGVAFYLKKVRSDPVLFLLAFSYLVNVGSHSIHLDPVLICVAAGLVITNTTNQGERLLSIIQHGSLVIYVIFFCVAGAALDLMALRSMVGLAALLVIVRMALLWGCTSASMAVARVPNAKASTYWMAFLPQAGVSLGLASVLEKEGFDWAPPVVTLLIACIAINQIVGPILMKYALQQTGETAETAVARNRTSPQPAKT
ncbi:MAG: cation:proton antiporter [Candidatus Hinthialibacter antarcticus]|nr:cation:proton antiporter [Candidatus Hinthialibacter antarcticus]